MSNIIRKKVFTDTGTPPTAQVQADMAQTDNTQADFVKNKFQSDTWANWDAAKTAGTLPKGAFIRVTDPNGADEVTVFVEEVNALRKEGEALIYGSIDIQPKITTYFEDISAVALSYIVTNTLTFDNAATAEILAVSDSIRIYYSNLAGALNTGDHVTGTDTGFTGIITALDVSPDYIIVQVTGGDPFVAGGETEITITESLEVGDIDNIEFNIDIKLTSGTITGASTLTNDQTANVGTINSNSGNIISSGQVLTGSTSGATSTIVSTTSDSFTFGTAVISDIIGAYQAGEVITTPGGGNAFADNVTNASEVGTGWVFKNYDWPTNTVTDFSTAAYNNLIGLFSQASALDPLIIDELENTLGTLIVTTDPGGWFIITCTGAFPDPNKIYIAGHQFYSGGLGAGPFLIPIYSNFVGLVGSYYVFYNDANSIGIQFQTGSGGILGTIVSFFDIFSTDTFCFPEIRVYN